MDGFCVLNTNRDPILIVEPAGDPFSKCLLIRTPRNQAALGPEDVQRLLDWLERFQAQSVPSGEARGD